MRPPYSGLKQGVLSPVVCGRKFCASCGRWRLVADFSPRADRPERPRSWCDRCTRVKLRQRRQGLSPRQRELRREYNRIWAEVRRRRQGVPPRRWRTPRPLPPGDRDMYLDTGPLVAELARWDGHQWALAELAGLPARAIYRIESGEVHHVQLDTADRLALALGRSIVELWEFND